jgi:hypothetical protein
MGIFSDILSKSRFEQQPIKGNFLPRRSPKDNTTSDNEDESAVLLTKESPRPVPGTSAPHPDPKRREKPKGRRAGGTFEADAAVPDDSTYIIGLEKVDRSERFGRQVSRAKRDAQEARRDKAQKEMYEGSPGRRLKTGDPTSPKKRSSVLSRSGGDDPEMTPEAYPGSEVADTARIYTTGLGRDMLRRRRRAGMKSDRENAVYEALTSHSSEASSSPKKGQGWKLTRGPRGGRNRSIGATTPTSTSRRAERFGLTGRGIRTRATKQSSDILWGHERKPDSIDYKRGSDRYKNIDRATIRHPETINSMMKARKNNIYAIATDAAEGDEDKKEEIVRALKRGKMMLKAFGVPISMPGGKQRILPVIPNSEGGFFTKETSGRHSLHPVARRPKTVTEKERDSHADGGEENFSGARGATPALLGMIKAGEKTKKIKDMTREELAQAHKDGTIRINRSYRPGQPQHPEYAEEQAKIDENVELLDKALLWPAHKKEQQGGRKVKTRVGDSIGGYPT